MIYIYDIYKFPLHMIYIYDIYKFPLHMIYIYDIYNNFKLQRSYKQAWSVAKVQVGWRGRRGGGVQCNAKKWGGDEAKHNIKKIDVKTILTFITYSTYLQVKHNCDFLWIMKKLFCNCIDKQHTSMVSLIYHTNSDELECSIFYQRRSDSLPSL